MLRRIYFAQDQYKALDPEARLLDDLTRAAPSAQSTQTELRGLLGCFLSRKTMSSSASACFPAANAIAMRWRECCCIPPISCCSTSPPTISICAPKTWLLESLEKYTARLCFVSHDRYFIDKLATRVFEIGNGEVNVFLAITKTTCGARAERN